MNKTRNAQQAWHNKGLTSPDETPATLDDLPWKSMEGKYWNGAVAFGHYLNIVVMGYDAQLRKGDEVFEIVYPNNSHKNTSDVLAIQALLFYAKEQGKLQIRMF